MQMHTLRDNWQTCAQNVKKRKSKSNAGGCSQGAVSCVCVCVCVKHTGSVYSSLEVNNIIHSPSRRWLLVWRAKRLSSMTLWRWRDKSSHWKDECVCVCGGAGENKDENKNRKGRKIHTRATGSDVETVNIFCKVQMTWRQVLLKARTDVWLQKPASFWASYPLSLSHSLSARLPFRFITQRKGALLGPAL